MLLSLFFCRYSNRIGKNWHASKKPFRPGSGMTSYAKRVEERKHQEAIKEHEKELKEEKENERQVAESPFIRGVC